MKSITDLFASVEGGKPKFWSGGAAWRAKRRGCLSLILPRAIGSLPLCYRWKPGAKAPARSLPWRRVAGCVLMSRPGASWIEIAMVQGCQLISIAGLSLGPAWRDGQRPEGRPSRQEGPVWQTRRHRNLGRDAASNTGILISWFMTPFSDGGRVPKT